MVYLVMVDMSFSENNFVLISAKFTYQILFQGISDATNMVIYYAVTIENQRKKINFTYLLVMFLGLLKWLTETRFYERKKKI